MKRLIFASIIAFLLFLASKLIFALTDLGIMVETEYFTVLGISLAFCWSSLLYVSSQSNFPIGLNVGWLAVALPVLVHNIGITHDWLIWAYLFFFVFPLGFLIKYLFFSKELKDVFIIRMISLISFALLAVLATFLLITI